MTATLAAISLLCSLLCARAADAYDVGLAWTATDAAAYNIYVRHSGSTTVHNVAGSPNAQGLVEISISGLPLGPQLYFSASTIDDEGEESPESNVLSLTYPAIAAVIDSDNDGLTDAEEDLDLDLLVDAGETDPQDFDSDDDGVGDGLERAHGIDPLNADTDDDGINDAQDGCHDFDFDGFGEPGVSTTTCGPDNCPVLFNPTQLDRDADTMGDRCDPCTNVGGARNLVGKAALVLRKINTDPFTGNDGLLLKGEIQMAAGTTFADLDPLVEGMRLSLTSTGGTLLTDQAIPGGLFPGSRGTRGWRGNSSNTVWRFVDKTFEPVAGLKKIIVRDRGRRTPGMVQIVVSASDGTFPVGDADAPVKASLALGGEVASQFGRCGETAFTAAECGFNRSRQVLRCPQGRR